jgi:crotonobetainyl-CoA:carnitine CoA-transferase CaiB-like acyl-CoA transferase
MRGASLNGRAVAASRDVTRLLAGVRVVDFTFQAAGAYGAMLLACLGAEVIKVESAVHPDPTRGRIKDRPYSHSVFFEDVNVGKLSLALNLKQPEGVTIARRLICESHATLDNFRPGVLARLGLDPDDLLRQQPGLVCASLSAAGGTGPYAQLPGYAGIFNALSGLGEMTGYPDGPPTELRTSVDMRAGAAFAMAVVAGLVGARRTGKGGRIDFSAAEAISMLCGDSLAEYSLTCRLPKRTGNAHAIYSPHGVYRCRDGWIFLAARDDSEWARLAALLTGDGLPVSSELAAADRRRQCRAQIDALVNGWTSSRDRRSAFEALQRAGLPAGPAVTARDMEDDPQFAARAFVTRATVATTTRTRAVGEAPWMTGGRRPEHSEPPALGRDTRDVLRRVLRMPDATIDELQTAGVLQ